jgi:hypothetical protein
MNMRTRNPGNILALCLTGAYLLAASGCGGGAEEILIPEVYLVAGQVVDPTESPLVALPGAMVAVQTAPQVAPVITDTDGFFVLQGLPPGRHRLIANLAGRVTTVSIELEVDRSLVDLAMPLFTTAQIDSILEERQAPPWDRQSGLFGLFALRSTGVPLGDANLSMAPDPGGEIFQTGEGADPIVWVNTIPGRYSLTVTHSGYRWPNPYTVTLQPGVVTFGAPRALLNITGFLFADRSTGAPVSDAVVDLVKEVSEATTSTDFLGQFNFVGLEEARYYLHHQPTGLMGGLGWPTIVDEDTTLSQVVFHPDTLAAWSVSAGGPLPDPQRGHVALDLRASEGGAPLIGWRIEADPGGGSYALPQRGGIPALLINLESQSYVVRVMDSTGTQRSITAGVNIHPGKVAYTRLEL